MRFHTNWRPTAVSAALFSVLGLAVTVSCSHDYSEPTLPNARVVAGLNARPLSVEEKDRLAAAFARTKWVGEAHHAGMQVAIATIAQHRKAKRALPKKGSRDYCAILESVGKASLAILDKQTGVVRSAADRRARIHQDKTFASCSRELAVFGRPIAPFGEVSLHLELEPEVTGAYESYLDPMYTAVITSGGSVSGIESGVNAVLAQAVAERVPEGDLLALTSFASLAISSAQEWNTFDWRGLSREPGCNLPEGCFLLSMFPFPEWEGSVLKVVGADAGGCLSTVKGWKALKLLLGTPAWIALGGECGLRGTLASAGAIFALM